MMNPIPFDRDSARAAVEVGDLSLAEYLEMCAGYLENRDDGVSDEQQQ